MPDFEVIPGNEMSEEEVKKIISEAYIVLGDYTFKQKITADILSAARNLKFIQQPSVGYQHINVDACTARGIKVANTAGANTISVAEHTIAWTLSSQKHVSRSYKHEVGQMGTDEYKACGT